ncbi:portal protein [Rhizobium sp. Root274]|uniref:phage portal protein n=1 Tax=unclassified Rhizobium TaxID=2613769 RepID=UPI000715E8CB|nr:MULTISPECIES: phage portal protein [unclassified Rhizobium]KQW31147.1 portal protein [Rhizobium sp. Root1240]KRD32695.1 portal protein [Rhizobium sp. Root274]
MKFPFRLPWAQAPDRARASDEKALSPRPGMALALIAGEGEARWTGRSYAALSREGFMRNPVAHRCVRLVSEAAASIGSLAYQGPVEREDHPALSLLSRPNGAMTGADFLEALYGQLLLSGNAFVEAIAVGAGAGATAELHLLRPDRVSVVSGADGWPAGYDYRAGTAARRIALDGLLHLKLFHPLDDHLGFAPLAAAQVALDLHNAAGRWNKALLDNSARPSGALVYQPKEGGNLTSDQYQRLKVELDEGYSGPMRAGRPLLLEGGLDWKSMGLSPKDMDFVEAKNGAARDIALAFGVPPMLLGIPGDNTYANYQEANRAFYRLTVLPLVTRTAAALSRFLGALTGEGLKLVPDLDTVAGLAAERDALWGRVGAAGFLTDEEKREAVGY